MKLWYTTMCAAILIVAGCDFGGGPTVNVEYVFPEGFRGPVRFVIGEQGMEIPDEDYIRIEIPESGVLKVRDPFLVDKWRRESAYYRTGEKIRVEFRDTGGSSADPDDFVLRAGPSTYGLHGHEVWMTLGTLEDTKWRVDKWGQITTTSRPYHWP